MKKKFGMIHQLQSVGANAMHQDDNTFSRLARKQPAMHCCAAGTLELNRLNRQIGGRFSNFAIAWSNQNRSLVPREQNKGKRSDQKKAGNYFQLFLQTLRICQTNCGSTISFGGLPVGVPSSVSGYSKIRPS